MESGWLGKLGIRQKKFEVVKIRLDWNLTKSYNSIN